MIHSARIGLLMLCTGLSPLALAHNPICECEEHGTGDHFRAFRVIAIRHGLPLIVRDENVRAFHLAAQPVHKGPDARAQRAGRSGPSRCVKASVLNR